MRSTTIALLVALIVSTFGLAACSSMSTSLDNNGDYRNSPLEDTHGGR